MQTPGHLLAFLKTRDRRALRRRLLAEPPRAGEWFSRVRALSVRSEARRVLQCVSRPGSAHSQPVRLAPAPRLVLGPWPARRRSPASPRWLRPPCVGQRAHLPTGSPELDSEASGLPEFPGEPSVAWAARSGWKWGKRKEPWLGLPSGGGWRSEVVPQPAYCSGAAWEPPGPSTELECLPARPPAGRYGALPEEGERRWNPGDGARQGTAPAVSRGCLWVLLPAIALLSCSLLLDPVLRLSNSPQSLAFKYANT